MAEPAPAAPAVDEGEGRTREFGLDPALVARVAEALDRNDEADVRAAIADLHYSELADLIETLTAEHRHRLIELLRRRFPAEVIPELDEDTRDEVANQLGTQDLAKAIAELDSDDALYLIEGLEEAKRRQVLHAIPAAIRRQIEEGLAFPEESAGRLMQREVVAVPEFWDVGQVIDDLRESDGLPDDFYDVFVVDPKHRPVGWVPLDKLVRAKRPVKVRDIMETDLEPIPADMDQEKVAYLFKQHDLTSAPVVDAAGRLVGTITIDDVVDVIEEEAEEDLMRLGGVGETDIHLSAVETAPRRIRWLLVTLINTLMASFVISRFEATIEQIVALAILMPIVAAMGGNAGMQAVTVTVRGLATREVTPANALRLVWKELFVGLANGVFFATIMGTIAGLWFSSAALGGILAAAMIFNMLWAALAGTAIPLLIHRVGWDPAISAGPFLTTMTDVMGFLSFLGLATLLLL